MNSQTDFVRRLPPCMHVLLCFVALMCLSLLPSANAEVSLEAADKRCKCICPRVNGTGRAVYIRDVTPEQCNCDHVVLPGLSQSSSSAGEFCARCQCKHENRNSMTIKGVVIAFIVVTGLLLVYMLYLVVEARFFKGTKTLAEDTNISYEQHLDEEDQNRGTGEQQPFRRSSIRGRLSDQMAKWKKAVMQQRGNVYIRRTVLNN